MDWLQRGLQDLCCTSRLRSKTSARCNRRRWQERVFPEKKERFEEIEAEEVVGQQRPNLAFYDEEMTVLVSDLKGFASTVRKHGILHFASIIMRKRQLCWPILAKHEAVKVTVDADNLIAAFRSAKGAVKAALEMREALQTYNESLKEDRQHFSIQLSGIGLHAGMGLFVNAQGDFLGEVACGAYCLGEDLCEDSTILVSQAVRARLLDEPFFAPAVFREAGEEPNTKIKYFALDGDFDLQVEVVPADDPGYLEPSLLPLAQRHGLMGREELAKLDETFRQHFKPRAVLRFRSASFYLYEDQAAMREQARELVAPILRRFAGQGLEVELWIFERPLDAVHAALCARDACSAAGVKVQGWGVDFGDLLFIPGTDVHWGDAVNTASKLGQDLAADNSILITSRVKDACLGDAGLMHLQMETLQFSLSGITFECFQISKTEGQASEPQGHRRGSSMGGGTRTKHSAQRQGAKAQCHAASATNWNDLATLSPQILLDRFAKRIDKGRSWWDFAKEASLGPEVVHKQEPKKQEALQCPEQLREELAIPTAQTALATEGVSRCDLKGQPLEEAINRKAEALATQSPRTADPKAAESVPDRPGELRDTAASKRGYGGQTEKPAELEKVEIVKAANFKENRDLFSRAGGFAGQQSDLKSRVSRREAEALLQRLTASAALGQDLDEVRRLRKLVDERTA